MATIYKICEQKEWLAAQHQGEFRGSEVDARDGFIHFSTAAQLAGTVGETFCRRDRFVAGRGRRRRARPGAQMGALARRRSVSAPLRRFAARGGALDASRWPTRWTAAAPCRSFGRDRRIRACRAAAARGARSGRRASASPSPCLNSRRCRRPARTTSGLRVRAFGLNFPNPVGMAAGFDKNAEVAGCAVAFGLRLRRSRHHHAAAAAGQSAAAGLSPRSRCRRDQSARL